MGIENRDSTPSEISASGAKGAQGLLHDQKYSAFSRYNQKDRPLTEIQYEYQLLQRTSYPCDIHINKMMRRLKTIGLLATGL